MLNVRELSPEVLEKRSFDVASIPGARDALRAVYQEMRSKEEEYYASLAGIRQQASGASVQEDRVRACPVCQSDRCSGFIATRGLDIVLCGQCAHVYSRNIIRSGDEDTRYHNAYGPVWECYLRLKSSPVLAAAEAGRNRYYAALCEQYRGVPASWLDIGSGNGSLLRCVKTRGWTPLGIDQNPVWQRSGEYADVPLVTGYFPEDLPEHGLFDCISLLDVLEHQESPVTLLRQVYDQLKPEGIVFIQVPNLRSLLIRVEGAANSNFCPGHWSYFDAEHLTAVAQQAGFSLLQTDTVISELDRVLQYSPVRIAEILRELTGQDCGDVNGLNDSFIYKHGLGYKLLGVYTKEA